MSKTLFTLFESAITLMSSLVYLIVAMALFGFMYGVVRYLLSGGNEQVRKESREFMIYGILILFVMTSLWGLVYLLRSTIFDDTYNGEPSSEGTAGGDSLSDSIGDADSQFDRGNSDDFTDLDRY